MSATQIEDNIYSNYLPPVNLWQAVEPLIPFHCHKRGRKRLPDEPIFDAIFYVLRTGIQWKALPRCLGAASTVHQRFLEWVEAGVFFELWRLGLMELNCEGRLKWDFQSIDSAYAKAPLAQQAVGPNPTDRGKAGVKRHMLTDGQGLPISICLSAASVHDVKLVDEVLEQMPLLPPLFEQDERMHFCADKAYDSRRVRSMVRYLGYEDHIITIGQEREYKSIPGYRARRWVCERTHSWLNRYRRLLIRWEKKKETYLAFIHLACATLVWKHSAIFG